MRPRDFYLGKKEDLRRYYNYMVILTFWIVLAAALLLFITEVLPLEISGLFILFLLVVSGLLPERFAFASLGDSALVLIGSLSVLTAALNKTGFIASIERFVYQLSGQKRSEAFLLMLLLIAGVSSLIGIAAAMILFIPLISGIAIRYQESPKRWLMPAAFAAVLGGMTTVVGTPTNVVASTLLTTYGLPPFSLFTLSAATLPLLVFGVLYLYFFSNTILGTGLDETGDPLERKYNLRSYTAEVNVLDESPLCGLTIAGSPLFREVDITVLGVVRKNTPILVPQGSLVISKGDRLVVEGNLDRLTQIAEKYRLELVKDVPSSEQSAAPGIQAKIAFHEVVVTEKSLLHRRSPAEAFLRPRYRISLLAINRQGTTIHERLSRVRIATGDVLLVQFLGRVDASLLDYLGLVPLEKFEHEKFHNRRPFFAFFIFALALTLGSLHIPSITLPLSCLAGAVAVVAFKIIKPIEAYEALDWKFLIMLASVIALGLAFEKSGAAAALAYQLSPLFLDSSPLLVLALFFVATTILTQPLPNQAAAALMLPLAVHTGTALGMNPTTLAVAVTMAASCSFLTPLEPAYLLVYGPGGYKFSDFFRLGVALNVLAVVVGVFAISLAYKL